MRTNHPPPFSNTQFSSSHIRRAGSSIAGLCLVCLTTSAVHAEMRTWENQEGRKIRAEFVRVAGDNVQLKLESGRMSQVEIRKLSQTDQAFVKTLTAPPEDKTPSPPAPSAPLAVPSAHGRPQPAETFPNDDGATIPPHLQQKWIYLILEWDSINVGEFGFQGDGDGQRSWNREAASPLSCSNASYFGS